MVPWAYDGRVNIASASSARLRRVIEHLLTLVPRHDHTWTKIEQSSG
jgi:hypothetical protein